MSPFAFQVGITIGNVLTLMMVVLMISGSLLTVAERKWSALLQNRIGANRITVAGNPLGGIPYLLADALKMLTKEATGPDARTRLLFELAPVLSFAPVFCLFAIVPVGPPVNLAAFFGGVGGAGQAVALQVAQLDAGLLYLFAIASLSVYGTSLAGWASNNKLALLGGVRASSQMITYEVSHGALAGGHHDGLQDAAARGDGGGAGAAGAGRLPGAGPAAAAASASSSSSPRASPRPSAPPSTSPRARARSSATSSSTRA